MRVTLGYCKVCKFFQRWEEVDGNNLIKCQLSENFLISGKSDCASRGGRYE